ncbi:hypothetical protein OIU77_021132 [Salix suchowensis]|uniref:Photosystem II protein I n=1 Tax=Salix suchowensis TaxID=1278906 RepID=A0ABQ9CC78_9ROSI|nr:hypothetical protein OIU77_021132 [Salix suchowensis]
MYFIKSFIDFVPLPLVQLKRKKQKLFQFF